MQHDSHVLAVVVRRQQPHATTVFVAGHAHSSNCTVACLPIIAAVCLCHCLSLNVCFACVHQPVHYLAWVLTGEYFTFNACGQSSHDHLKNKRLTTANFKIQPF
jgi:hypothetical protein